MCGSMSQVIRGTPCSGSPCSTTHRSVPLSSMHPRWCPVTRFVELLWSVLLLIRHNPTAIAHHVHTLAERRTGAGQWLRCSCMWLRPFLPLPGTNGNETWRWAREEAAKESSVYRSQCKRIASHEFEIVIKNLTGHGEVVLRCLNDVLEKHPVVQWMINPNRDYR